MFAAELDLREEQLLLRESVRDFCSRQIGSREQREHALDPDEEDHSTAVYRELAALGWLGIGIAEEYGGSGGTYLDLTVLFEELARSLAPTKAMGPTMTVAGCVARYGNERQKHEVLSSICQGELMSISISEPGAGSDIASIRCAAEQTAGGYVINGQKTWCSYAHRAKSIVLLARTSRSSRRHEGLTMFLIPADLPGMTTRRIGTMGGREVNEIFFTDVHVTAEHVLGEVGRGFQQVMGALVGERLIGAAVALGTAQRALDDALAYVKEREQFGQPIWQFQSVRHRLADVFIELESTRLMTYRLARLSSDKTADSRALAHFAAATKIKATETVKRATLDGLQVMGAYGYSTEADMESLVRHALIMPIYAGSNEVMRDVVADGL